MALIHTTLDAAVFKAEPSLDPGIIAKLKALLGAEFAAVAWRWFRNHEQDVIYTINKKVWFINVKFDVKVGHAKRLLEELAGPEPLE